MDIDGVAFRALIYAEAHRLRLRSPVDYLEHCEEMGEPRGQLLLVFIPNLAPEDWLAIRAMDVTNPATFSTYVAALTLIDTDRLEAMLHALDYASDLGVPPQATGLDQIIERWDEVDIAMGNAFWSQLVEDLPELDEPFAGSFARQMRGWPRPGQDPAEAASTFQTATESVVREATPAWYRKTWAH